MKKRGIAMVLADVYKRQFPYRTLSLEIVFHFLAVQKNWIKHLHGQQNMDCRF